MSRTRPSRSRFSGITRDRAPPPPARANQSGYGTAHAGYRLDQLALAVAVDAGDPDDLACRDRQTDTVERAPSVALDRQILYFEQAFRFDRVYFFDRARAAGSRRGRASERMGRVRRSSVPPTRPR